MKRRLILFYGCIILISLFIQSGVSAQKYDNNWLVGYNFDIPPAPFNNSRLNFSGDTVKVTHEKTLCNFWLTISISISDSSGNFLFYSDGCKIVGKDNKILVNGDGLNPGEIADSYCPDGYPLIAGGLVLPTPHKPNEYEFLNYLLKSTDKYGNRPLNLLNHHISLNSGKGVVDSKNISILADTFAKGNMSACKHANGMDWWIIAPRVKSNSYYNIILDKDGFLLKGIQNVGPIYDYISDWSGQSVFSPNGKKYARFDRGNPLTIFDFNRCDGTLSNPIHLDILDSNDTLALGCGLAFSASSRFLYALSGCLIYQFDMEANDILASKTIVGNGWKKEYTANFYLAQLAPDNKIYMSSASEGTSLHVIESPDLKGLACNVKEYGLKLYEKQLGALTFYPNYRLGPLEYSCDDTLKMKVEQKIVVFPNPSIDKLKVLIKGVEFNDISFKLYDVLGRLVYQKSIEEQLSFLDISFLPSAVYFYQVSSNSDVLKKGEIIVIK